MVREAKISEMAKSALKMEYEPEVDILTIYLEVQKLMGSPLGPVHGPAKPGEQRRSVLDSTLAQTELGWQPRVSLAQGLAQTAASFR